MGDIAPPGEQQVEAGDRRACGEIRGKSRGARE